MTRNTKTQAERADKYRLYQKSVQNPVADLRFADKVFKRRFGRKPTTMREDFCGTALACCSWVKRRPENHCWGIDLDPEPLAWGREHNLAKLDEETQSRITLLRGDVMAAATPRVDVIMSQNFSFCIFKTREELRRYFERCRAGLDEHGILVLDIFGGAESQVALKDKQKHGSFTYVWDQAACNAITNEILCHVHFRFKDGSRLKRAFTYDWRLWTIQELRELLLEAGFEGADAYWEGPGKNGNGDGVFRRKSRAENEDAWVAYVVGTRADTVAVSRDKSEAPAESVESVS